MNNSISDKFGRYLKYLRISVTDRCNFHCKYCMPTKDFKFLNHNQILSYEDLLFTTEVFASLGVNRVRITGGEPLVRKNICQFLEKLVNINGINEVMVTTNGALLNKFALDLYNAGVKRLNISLDSLKKDRVNEITGTNNFDNIILGIKKAVSVGFKPIKVNVVVIKGFNDDEILDFCKFAADENIIVRFIEFMPIGNSNQWGKDTVIVSDEILNIISKFNPIPLKKDINSGPAQNYALNNGATIGIISPISRHFCETCDKLRLTADGKIRPCLLSDKEMDLNNAIKSRNKDMLKDLIVNSIQNKSKEHNISCGGQNGEFKRTMSKIGG